ncbi:Ig-like domain repeat protein [Flavimobilis soli]|uniref:Ig-like domain repeat protein n=1 Tax=Flavimobilis soli TaxID=442709 RepID=UPI001179B688|nr:Ig-like domain repeat protein [Flavimobilis soli]
MDTRASVRKAKAQTAVKVVKKPTAGKSGSVRVTVTAKGSSVRAGGSYVVKVRGKVVAKGRLTNGTGTARLPKLAAGKHKVQVSYKGSPQVAKANRTITVTVR